MYDVAEEDDVHESEAKPAETKKLEDMASEEIEQLLFPKVSSHSLLCTAISSLMSSPIMAVLGRHREWTGSSQAVCND